MNEARQGFFGKIPGHGDFVERGLPSDFVQKWDGWLRESVAQSKTLVGSSWLDAYLASPVWRFVIGPGVCGEEAWVGILIPGFDKVGRHFPLTLVAAVSREQIPVQTVILAADWLDGLEALAVNALSDRNVDADQLIAAIADLGPPNLEGALLASKGIVQGPSTDILSLPFTYGTTPGQGLMALTHRLLEYNFGANYSVWWSTGSPLVEPGLVACADLPNIEAYAGMLSDECTGAGWTRLPGYRLQQEVSSGIVEPSERDAERIVSVESDEVDETGQFSDLFDAAKSSDVDLQIGPGPDRLANVGTKEEDQFAPLDDGDFNPEQVSADEILAGFGAPSGGIEPTTTDQRNENAREITERADETGENAEKPE